MFTIQPHRKNGVWIFDDNTTGLLDEPLVCEELIIALLKKAGIYPGAHRGFTLEFDNKSFEGAELLDRQNHESGGVWYAYHDIRGWLCPMLFRYFETAPSHLWVRASRTVHKGSFTLRYERVDSSLS